MSEYTNVKLLITCALLIIVFVVTSYLAYVRTEMASFNQRYSFSTTITSTTEDNLSREEKRDQLIEHYERISQNRTRKKRLPDIIGIGVEKCGSGALIHFLRQHPLIQVKATEAHYFDGQYYKGEDYYKEKLAEVSDIEMAMEKTPAYFNKPEVDIPNMIKRDVPHAKLIVILCDPVNRTFSDFIHEQIAGTIPKDVRFEVFIDQYLRHFIGKPFENMNDRSSASYIKAKDQNFHLSHLISTGLYYYHMKHWYEHFNRSNLFVADGEELLTDPGKVTGDIQDFLGLPRLLLPSDFQKSPKTRFYCVKTISSKNRTLDCLETYRKGRTRLGTIKPPEITMKKLRQFYRPYNRKLFQLLGRTFAWQ